MDLAIAGPVILEQGLAANPGGAVLQPSGRYCSSAIARAFEPFDDPAFLFELKYDGFRGIADTIRGRMLSKGKNRMNRFEGLLQILPEGCVFDGEIVAPDQ